MNGKVLAVVVEVFFLLALSGLESVWQSLRRGLPRVLWALAELACAASPAAVAVELATPPERQSVMWAIIVTSLMGWGMARYTRLRVDLATEDDAQRARTKEQVLKAHFGAPFGAGWVSVWVFHGLWVVVEVSTTVAGIATYFLGTSISNLAQHCAGKTGRRWLKIGIGVGGALLWCFIWTSLTLAVLSFKDSYPLLEKWMLAAFAPLLAICIAILGKMQLIRLQDHYYAAPAPASDKMSAVGEA